MSNMIPKIQANEIRSAAAPETTNDAFYVLESARNSAGEIFDFRFVFVNAIAARLLSTTPEDLRGELLCRRFPINITDGAFARYKRVVESGESLHVEIPVRLEGSSDVGWLHLQVLKLDDGIAIATTDITERKKTESVLAEKNRRIQESELRLSEVQKLARLGDWEFDVNTDKLWWSPEIYRLFDIAPECDPLSLEEISALVHRDDHDRILALALQVMQVDAPHDVYVRFMRTSGGICYVQGRAKRHLNSEGVVERLSGTMIDVTEKVELHDALRASNDRFEIFMENSPALTFIKDREGRMIYMNRSCQKMWGLDPAASAGKIDLELWSPKVAEEFRMLDLMVLDNDTPDSLVETIQIPGGLTRSLLTCKFPLRVPGREALIGGVAIDISMQREAEEKAIQALADRDVLLKEVHHRVKNNLQVICSLLEMQATGSDDPRTVAALRVSQDRVQAMAMIHELLYGSKAPGELDFSEYAGRLMGELFISYGVTSSRIMPKFNIVPLRLETDRAILCGLIMNELISNSLKYAFPLQQPGEIIVSLAPYGVEQLQMTVEDNGIGMPEEFSVENAASLGLRIVQILVKQLDGTLSFASQKGSRFEMTFPIAALNAAEHAIPL